MPKTRRAFWKPKKEGNVRRDQRAIRALRRLGYGVLVIWECELKDTAKVKRRIRAAVNRRKIANGRNGSLRARSR